mgnify:CR=1 FL=1
MGKVVVRKGIFETNSSSVHTLTIDATGMEPSHLPMTRDHRVIGHFGTFGKNREIFSEQSEKFSYIISQLYYINGYDKDLIKETVAFENLEEALMDYIPGCTGIHISNNPSEPDIDHQSLWDSDWDSRWFSFYDKKSIQEFIFNKYISIKTDCD